MSVVPDDVTEGARRDVTADHRRRTGEQTERVWFKKTPMTRRVFVNKVFSVQIKRDEKRL